MKNRLFLLICLVLSSYKSSAQITELNYPKVGEEFPNHTFNDVVNYQKKSFSISDYRGKWLVLDYWAEGCVGCIASFPKMDKLHKNFKGRAEVIMVGVYTKTSTRVKAIFGFRSNRYNLKFPSAFDSASVKKYDIGSVPAIFIIDPNGILIAKTLSMDSIKLEQIISGKMPALERSYSAHEKKRDFDWVNYYDVRQPLLTSGKVGNGGIDTSAIFRTVLTAWNSNMPKDRIVGFDETQPELLKGRPGMAEAIGVNLSTLFLIAYTGKAFFNISDSLYGILNPKVVFETKKTTNHFVDVSEEELETTELFAYSLKMPMSPDWCSNARKMLMDDLYRCLGYTAILEERDCDVYKLIISDYNKVIKQFKTKGYDKAISEVKAYKNDYYLAGDSSIFQSLTRGVGFRLYNMQMKDFFNRVFGTLFDTKIKEEAIFTDETGLHFRIDFTTPLDHRDFNALVESLSKYGLSLEKGSKKMKCIVVRNAHDVHGNLR